MGGAAASQRADAHQASTVPSELLLLYPRGHGFGPQEGWAELGVDFWWHGNSQVVMSLALTVLHCSFL